MCDLIRLCVHARSRNDMAQEFYLAAEQGALHGFRVRPAPASLANRRSSRSSTWDTVAPYTVTSSMYRTRPWPIRSRKRVSMRRLNVAGALQSPYAITRNSNKPLSVAKVVMGWEAGSSATCQNPEARSTEQYQVPPGGW